MSTRESLLSNGDDSGYSKFSDDKLSDDSTSRSTALSPTSAATTSSLSAKLKQHRRWVIAFVAAIVLIMLVAAAYAIIRKAEDDKGDDPNGWYKSGWRLPASIAPSHYALNMSIDLTPASLSFSGEVAIQATVVAATFTVVLHAQLMTVDRVSLRSAAKGDLSGLTWKQQDTSGDSGWVDNQFLVVDLAGVQLPAGDSINLTVAYHAPLTNSLAGLYYSTYNTSAGQQVYIATTQFEPTDARRAFPCFDEPAMKANFTVTIAAQSEHPTTLFNTEPVSSETFTYNGASWYRTTFATTPAMSTYLLAWVVSGFQRTNMTTNRGTVFSTWARPAQVAATINATQIGAKQTEKYEALFKVNFPLKKQDQIAIPDFAAGAMENWGLITYRETALLYDPVYNSDAELQGIARVIAHELGHQWFGDIVTMKWWSDLWLNEGFASWVQYIGVNDVFPDWQMDEQFLTDTAAQAFTLDALPVPSTHPIIDSAVENNAQINSLFDAISYNKGACLIKHAVNILGFDTFIAGITRYLTQYSYSNANSYDLMQVLGAQGGLDLWGLMSTYLTQPNYPLLVVDEAITEAGVATWTVRQQRYLSIPNAAVDTSVSWNVPVNWVTEGGPTTQGGPVWLYANMSTLQLPATFDYTKSANAFLKLNVNQSFYARVQYPTLMYQRFASALQAAPTSFSIRDRTNLISDTFSLAYAGLVDWSLALNLTLYASAEEQLTPLTELIGQWDTLRPYFTAQADDLPYFETYVGYMLGPVYNKYMALSNFTYIDHVQNLIQSRVLSAAARYNIGRSREFVQAQFETFVASNRATRPWADIISTVLNYGSRGDDTAFATLSGWYASETNAAESNRLLAALASVDNSAALMELLGWTLDGTIRTQDAATVMSLVIGNNWAEFWNWFRRGNNADAVFAKFESGYAGLGRVLSALVNPITTQARLDEVTSYLSSKSLGGAKPAYNAAVSRAQSNIAFVNGPYQTVVAWMRDFSASHPPV